MRLPGADWPEGEVRKVIRFLRYLRRSGAQLARQFDRLPPGQRPTIRTGDQPSDLIFAMAEAAELAFAIDQPRLGLSACRELLTMTPHTPMQWALWGTVGALLGDVKVVLDPLAPQFMPTPSRSHRKLAPLPWPSSAPDVVRLATALIPAAAASGPFEDTVQPLFFAADHRLPPGALAMIKATPEFLAARGSDAMFDAPRQPFTDGFTTLELRYTQRLDMLRASPDWKWLRPRGTLVDWPLLALYVGLIRQYGEKWILLRAPTATSDGFFILELAGVLSERTQSVARRYPPDQG